MYCAFFKPSQLFANQQGGRQVETGLTGRVLLVEMKSLPFYHGKESPPNTRDRAYVKTLLCLDKLFLFLFKLK